MNWTKAVLSGTVGFVIAIVVAIAIERCGGAIGGIIVSVPTTIVPTSYVLLTESGKTKLEHAESLFAAPIGIQSCYSLLHRNFSDKSDFLADMEDSPNENEEAI